MHTKKIIWKEIVIWTLELQTGLTDALTGFKVKHTQIQERSS
jgi:hypothetical protein